MFSHGKGEEEKANATVLKAIGELQQTIQAQMQVLTDKMELLEKKVDQISKSVNKMDNTLHPTYMMPDIAAMQEAAARKKAKHFWNR